MVIIQKQKETCLHDFANEHDVKYVVCLCDQYSNQVVQDDDIINVLAS